MGAHELAFVGLAGSGLGTAVAVPMVWPRARRGLDVRLLGSALLLTSLIAALISARLAGLAPVSAAVEHAINVLGLCAFPLLVLYVRQAADVPITVRYAVSWWTPAFVYVVILTTRIALNLDTRVSFAQLLPIVLCFTAASVATLWRHRERRRRAVVPAEWVVAFVVLLNAAQIIRMQFAEIAMVRAVVPLVLSTGFVAIAVFATCRAMATPATPDATPRYERSGLDKSLLPELFARVDQALTRDRLFARSDLTLAQLAAAASATPHQVSEALNRYARVSFHDLVNRRRVEDVKAQLRDPASEKFTIEGIGASAGFGSRSALYAAFRRFEGTTPTAFRADTSSTIT